MKYKDYSDEIWAQIKTSLEEVKKQDPNPIAAFDADGTLWDIDLGELFFHHLIDNKLVDLPKDPWQHYLDLKAQDPKVAYLWLAQICKNHDLTKVRKWAREGVEAASPLPILMPQKKIIDLFLQNDVQVYIVTASITWAVEPGAEIIGLRKDNVIGVETAVHDGVIGNTQKGIITYRQGKVDALLERTQGKLPFFVSGNTMGDFELLKAATHARLAVSAASRDDKLFKTEFELQENAVNNSWLSHRFI
ncbi:putative haloacid dehalogenase-like hydrolase [Bdellovibrio bacteriovorus W]|nr:putative haloacid dehalogenase-like hydrolase [Bdellovibrio bacteriovorus W]